MLKIILKENCPLSNSSFMKLSSKVSVLPNSLRNAGPPHLFFSEEFAKFFRKEKKSFWRIFGALTFFLLLVAFVNLPNSSEF